MYLWEGVEVVHRYHNVPRCKECKAYLSKDGMHLKDSIKECSLLIPEERSWLVDKQLAKEFRKLEKREAKQELRLAANR